MPRKRTSGGFGQTGERASEYRRKTTRTAIDYAIWQAEFIGWPALAESFKRDLAEFDAGRLNKWGKT